MDNLMPIMNGVEAAKLIRSMIYPNLIVGVTGIHSIYDFSMILFAVNTLILGNVGEKEMKDFRIAGADVVLSKPTQISELKLIFDRVRRRGFKSYNDQQSAIDISAVNTCVNHDEDSFTHP
jgi:CheY-like chemotaxis protein